MKEGRKTHEGSKAGMKDTISSGVTKKKGKNDAPNNLFRSSPFLRLWLLSGERPASRHNACDQPVSTKWHAALAHSSEAGSSTAH
jgi:hypothetical protein